MDSILLVEDEHTLRMTLGDRLRKEGGRRNLSAGCGEVPVERSSGVATLPWLRLPAGTTDTPAIPPDSASGAPRRFEELDRIAIRIEDLNLRPTRPGDDVVAQLHTLLSQIRYDVGQVIDSQHQPVPSARLLLFPARERPRAGALGTTQQQVRATERHRRKRLPLLMLQREAKHVRVERDGTRHVPRLVPHAMHPESRSL
jgi:hypothetical protein